MKKNLPAFFALTFAVVFGAGTAHAQIQINAAIQNTAGQLAEVFERNHGVAVLAMHSDSARMSDHMVNEMIVAFIMMQHARGITVVNRVQLNAFAAQLNFGTADLIDGETARSLATYMNVRYVITGRLEPYADIFWLGVQVLDVETMEARSAYSYIMVDSLVASMMGVEYVPVPVVETPPEPPPPMFQDPTRFWSVGASFGFTTGTPFSIGTVQATLAPWRRWFFRVGCDFGFGGSDTIWVRYTQWDVSPWDNEPWHTGHRHHYHVTSSSSITPFAHLAFFLPFRTRGGWYIGAGGSLTRARYNVQSPYRVQTAIRTIGALDLTTGFNLGNWVDISYTLRTPTLIPTQFLDRGIHRVTAGFTWRIQQRDRYDEGADE